MIEIDHVAKAFAAPAAAGRGRFGLPPVDWADFARRLGSRAGAGRAASAHSDAAQGGNARTDGTRTGTAPRVVHAVRDVSLRAEDGRITGLLGPNGAGKTTTLRMLGGLIEPDAGTLAVDGIDVATRPRTALARLGMLSDARGLYARLTARENIIYYGQLQGMDRDAADARAQDLARMFDMTALLDRRAEGFSQGERMKTALVRALVHDPANIVLDEPTNGLDVLATRALRESLRFLKTPAGGGKCIVFSTHIMQEVERLCDQVVVVAEGCSVATGTVDELLSRTGQRDFEEAFVQLAFPTDPAAARVAAGSESAAA